MRQLYIRDPQIYIQKIEVVSLRKSPCANSTTGAFYTKRTNSYSILLQNAEFLIPDKNLILIGTARSYLTVILPNMAPGREVSVVESV